MRICIVCRHETTGNTLFMSQIGRTAYKPAPTDHDLRLTATRSPGLPFYTSATFVIQVTMITTRLSIPDVRKAQYELGRTLGIPSLA